MKYITRVVVFLMAVGMLMTGSAFASCASLNNLSTTTSWVNFSSLTLKAYFGMRNRTASTVNAQLQYDGGSPICNLEPDDFCFFETPVTLPATNNANQFERKRSSGGSATVDFFTCDTEAQAADDGGGDGQ